jgi:uncharacterized protein (DUF305 family)
MKTRLLSIAAVAIALTLVFAPFRVAPAQAQTGQMTPLDQLSGDDFDRAFLQQMTMHHATAVEMSRPAVAQAAHQETKDLAQCIVDSQTKEIAQMRTWARDWYGLDLPDPVAMMDQTMGQGQMTGPGAGQSQGTNTPSMNHSGMGPGMGPGMGMGTGQGGMPMQPGMPMGQMGDMSTMNDMSMMASLWKLPPNRLEVVFLTQMIPHHQSAVDMANLVPDRAAHQELKDLAKSIIQSQGDEITKMNGWLGSWYSL